MTASAMDKPYRVAVTEAIEPVRAAVHAAARRYPYMSDDYKRVMSLAISITIAEDALRRAMEEATDALLIEPIGS